MSYVLGHHPYEFGLVPDKEGYIKTKELLWAMNEEEDWRYVRQSHIREVLLSKERILFEVDENRIKTRERRWELNLENPCFDLPKLLFHPIRQRAHPHAMEKGLTAGPGENLLLAADREMAFRVGQRRDQKPVILEISVEQAGRSSTEFYSFGDLFLADKIPVTAILGPPLSKEFQKTKTKEIKEEPQPITDFRPGTFILEANRDPAPWRKDKGKKQKGWKEDIRKARRKRKR